MFPDSCNERVKLGTSLKLKVAAIDNTHMLASMVNVLGESHLALSGIEEIIHVEVS